MRAVELDICCIFFEIWRFFFFFFFFFGLNRDLQEVFAKVLSNFDKLPRYFKKLLLTSSDLPTCFKTCQRVSKSFLEYLGNLSKFDKTLAKFL